MLINRLIYYCLINSMNRISERNFCDLSYLSFPSCFIVLRLKEALIFKLLILKVICEVCIWEYPFANEDYLKFVFPIYFLLIGMKNLMWFIQTYGVQ